MICTPEEARQKECPMMQKKCDAEKCMAWKLHLVEGTHPDGWRWDRFPAPPPSPPLVLTGKGYCGMAKI